MTSLLIGLLLPAFFIAGGIYAVVRRGHQMRELAVDGVETTGTVTDKIEYPGLKGSRRSTRRIVYEYMDAGRQRHTHRSLVAPSVWDEHKIGGPIAVVYSRNRPNVSAPKFLVDLSREALARRR